MFRIYVSAISQRRRQHLCCEQVRMKLWRRNLAIVAFLSACVACGSASATGGRASAQGGKVIVYTNPPLTSTDSKHAAESVDADENFEEPDYSVKVSTSTPREDYKKLEGPYCTIDNYKGNDFTSVADDNFSDLQGRCFAKMKQCRTDPGNRRQDRSENECVKVSTFWCYWGWSYADGKQGAVGCSTERSVCDDARKRLHRAIRKKQGGEYDAVSDRCYAINP